MSGEQPESPMSTSHGLYFEEFVEGAEVTSPARTITESDVYLFAGLTGDYNPLHTDAEYAKGTLFGQRIAHGLLGLSIASGLGWRIGFLEGTTEAFLDLEWKFSKPIFIGDTIRIRVKIAEKRLMRRLGGGVVTFDVHMVNQHGDIVQKGIWRLLMRSKPA
jgi:3-hydroxybutyryl-CoA dehydratase